MSGTDIAPSDSIEVTLLNDGPGLSSMGDTGSTMGWMVDFAVPGREAAVPSSFPHRPPSSAASCIQLSFCPRDEPEEDEVEGAAVCSVHAAVRAESLSSSGVVTERAKSWGAKRSVTVMKWTATRAVGC
jgi:hypothetical protein